MRKLICKILLLLSLTAPALADTAPVTPCATAPQSTANKDAAAKPAAQADAAKNTAADDLKTLPDNYFFLLFLGALEYGHNKIMKTSEPLSGDENFQNGYYVDSRAAYFLKAKIKGKYLITSNLDTAKEEDIANKKMFRNLDPDKYYPIYGDASTRRDEVNSQGKFYLLIKGDKSEAVWGNFNTGFTGTQLASHNRSLYGGRVYYESVSTNAYAEPNTKFILYNARAHNLAAHNEFYGTGGSLYYLKDQKILEGSEKITIEIRDKLSNLPISSTPARLGFDYEIDYDRGRITFTRPVSSITSSDVLFNQTLLDGNKVFITVDYEYEPENTFDKGSYGARVKQNITKNLSLGGTYVEENKDGLNYNLNGVDGIIHLGGKSYLACEYAKSKRQQMNNYMSYDGGLTFADILNNATEGRAASADLRLYPSDKLEIDGYMNLTSPGFSSSDTTNLQGAKKHGFKVTSKLSEFGSIILRYDFQRLNQNAAYLTPASTMNTESKTAVAQYQHKKGKWTEYVEYSHFSNTGNSLNPKTRNINAKVEYQASDKLSMYAQNQTTIEGNKNNQNILGLCWKISDKIKTAIEEIMSDMGTGTRFSLDGGIGHDTQINTSYAVGNQFGTGSVSTLSLTGQTKLNEQTSAYTNYIVNDNAAKKTTDVSYGFLSRVDPKTKIYFENKDSYNPDGASRGMIFGTNYQPNDAWDIGASYEQGNFNDYTNYGLRNSGALSLGYNKKNFSGNIKGEARKDRGIQQCTKQYLFYGKIDWKMSDALYLSGKCNYSSTINTSMNTIAAKENETNIGIAYRPSKASKFNCLAKYTRLDNISAPWQTNLTDLDNTKNNVYAFEGVYKITNKLNFMGKYAYKEAMYLGSPINITSGTSLCIARSNYHIDNKTDLSIEYRRLNQRLAQDTNKGFLVEVSKKFYNYIWVGAGYNFTNFSDNLLSRNSYDTRGWFIRVIGNY